MTQQRLCGWRWQLYSISCIFTEVDKRPRSSFQRHCQDAIHHHLRCPGGRSTADGLRPCRRCTRLTEVDLFPHHLCSSPSYLSDTCHCRASSCIAGAGGRHCLVCRGFSSPTAWTARPHCVFPTIHVHCSCGRIQPLFPISRTAIRGMCVWHLFLILMGRQTC